MNALAPLSVVLGVTALVLGLVALVGSGSTGLLTAGLVGGMLAMVTGELGHRASGSRLGRLGAVLGVLAAFLAAFQLA